MPGESIKTRIRSIKTYNERRNKINRHLGQYRFDALPFHIRQPITAAVVEIGQSFMVQPKQVEHGRMKVVNAHPVLHGFVTYLIRRAKAHTAFDARASEPNQKTMRVVVASLPPFADGHAPEFPAPDHQRALP